MKFRKKPVVIDAVLFDGSLSSLDSLSIPELSQELTSDTCQIVTLEGVMTASKGDWVIRGVKGEHYPCKADIFAATYEAAQDEQPPQSNDQAIEQEIQAKGLTAPRITPADIESSIAETHYFTASAALDAVRLQWLMADHDAPAERQAARDVARRLGTMSEFAGRRDIDTAMGRDGNMWSQSLGLLTFCVLVLRNGFTVTGESACASPENFDAEIDRKIARDNAINKVWMLEGYLLKDRLHSAALAAQEAEEHPDETSA